MCKLVQPELINFVRILFVLIVATLSLLNGLFYYLVIFKFMSSTVRVNGTVQFSFFLIMKFSITIFMLIAILATYSFIIKAWKWTEETRPKRHKAKIWTCPISCDSFYLFFVLFLYWNYNNRDIFIDAINFLKKCFILLQLSLLLLSNFIIVITIFNFFCSALY